MAEQWMHGHYFTLLTPNLIRDNLPVQLLAESYVNTIQGKPNLSPSGWISRMNCFADRVAKETRKRTIWKCLIKEQPIQSLQPKCIHNRIGVITSGFDIEHFWDQCVEWMCQHAASWRSFNHKEGHLTSSDSSKSEIWWLIGRSQHDFFILCLLWYVTSTDNLD